MKKNLQGRNLLLIQPMRENFKFVTPYHPTSMNTTSRIVLAIFIALAASTCEKERRSSRHSKDSDSTTIFPLSDTSPHVSSAREILLLDTVFTHDVITSYSIHYTKLYDGRRETIMEMSRCKNVGSNLQVEEYNRVQI